MQQVMNTDIDKATHFLFDETYHMWRSDLQKIFRIGTRSKNGGCNFSSCILVLIGIESFSKYFSIKRDDKEAFVDFFECHYPDHYHGKMKLIYELFRNGLAHYYYPKSKFNQKNTAGIRFWLNRDMRVLPISSIKKDLDYYRLRGVILSPENNKPIVIVPQVLFIDTVKILEDLKKKVKADKPLQQLVIKNYIEIQKRLNHVV